MMISWMALGAIVLAYAAYLSYHTAWWRAQVGWEHPRILMYHMIRQPIHKAKFNKMRVSPQSFEAQLQWLVQEGFRFVTLSELLACYAQNQSLFKTVVLTFDDGYADNYYQALPLLKRYNAKATVYVVVDRHDRDWNVYKKSHHNSGELMREPKLSDAELLEMVNSGLIEIGSHSQTHAKLTDCDTSSKYDEINDSRVALQMLSQQAIAGFCYPFGLFDAQDKQLVSDSGYQHAVTTQPGIDDFSQAVDWLALKRIKVSGKDSLYDFRIRIKTGYRGWRRT